MICSTVSRPTTARSAPARTWAVNSSMRSCWCRKRWAAGRIISAVPPTLTIATASASHRMPCALTAALICTGISRLDRSSLYSRWTTGSTKTAAPITTFWPDRSVTVLPSAARIARPLRPVTMNASLGPATLIRDRMNMAMNSTSRTAPTIAMIRGDIVPSSLVQKSLDTRSGHDQNAGRAGYLDHEDPGTERERLGRPRVELDVLPGDGEAHLAVSAGRNRRDDHTGRAEHVAAGQRPVGGHVHRRVDQLAGEERGRYGGDQAGARCDQQRAGAVSTGQARGRGTREPERAEEPGDHRQGQVGPFGVPHVEVPVEMQVAQMQVAQMEVAEVEVPADHRQDQQQQGEPTEREERDDYPAHLSC